MSEHDGSTLEAAEAAAHWVLTLEHCSQAEKQAFAQWLFASELHAREFVLAVMCDRALRRIDPQRRLSVDLTAGLTAENVFSFPGGSALKPSR
jgi:ferric-dicitrate binding protein FerR (iron transport regulator)